MTRHEPDRPIRALSYVARHPSATVRQIMDAIDLASTNSVVMILRRLERDGLLKTAPCPHCGGRSLLVTEAGRQQLERAA